MQSSTEESIKIKQSAKLCLMLEERVDAHLLRDLLSDFHLDSKPRSGNWSNGLGNVSNTTKSSASTREFDTLQRFVRAGLIEGHRDSPYIWRSQPDEVYRKSVLIARLSFTSEHDVQRKRLRIPGRNCLVYNREQIAQNTAILIMKKPAHI